MSFLNLDYVRSCASLHYVLYAHYISLHYIAPCELQMFIIHTDPDRFPFVALSETEQISYVHLIFIGMRSIPQCPGRVQEPQKEISPAQIGLLQHRTTRPGSKLLLSDKAADAGAKLGRESAMQKPFPELINELGETGRGQSRQDRKSVV